MPETTAAKDPKPIDSIGAWIKAAQLKRNQNNPKFLQDTKSFLLTCEARSEALPILQSWEKTPISNKAIEAIFAVLLKYHAKHAEKRIASETKAKNWTMRVWGSEVLEGPETVLLELTFERGWDAERMADLWLCKSANYTRATIEAKTEKTKLTVFRLDAMARVFAKKAQAATVPTVRVSASRISLGVGGQYNKKVYFSRG